MKRTGRRYRTGRADDHYDVIVIGSGIGGLCNAALLSKLGKKVCVLEQHYTAGGFTHTYENGGYEWDVGVHYIGDVHKPHSPLRRIFDVISEGRLQWSPMDECYDRIIIEDREYDFRVGREAFKSMLKERFPDEAAAIDEYVRIVDRCSQSMRSFFFGQATSPTIGKLHRSLRRFLVPKEATMTVREVLESLTSNQELIAVLTGQWGDYGMVPAEATFLMHASVAKHYFSGGNYPVGGSWKMADTIIPTIQASGGEVFTYARVDEIVVEKGRAVGVRMDNGDVLTADKIVSSVGARLTYGKLLPEAVRRKYKYEKKLETVKPSGSSLCLFMGFKGNAEELQLPKTNLWIYPSADHEGNVARFAEDQNAEFPLVYVSFPSAKDPEWEEHYPGKSTVQVITMAPYEWFEQWSGSTWQKRGEDYEAIKAQFAQRLLKVLYKHMPQLESALDFYELATPLSTEWFHLYDRGEIYGLDHNPGRFDQDWLHPVSPVKNLYMTGQDVVTAGVGGALVAGMLTTGAMVGFKEFGKVTRMLKEWQPTSATGSSEPATI